MRYSKRRSWLISGLGLALGTTSTVAAETAHADNLDSSGSESVGGGYVSEVSLANNKWHSYSFQGGASTAWRTAFQDAWTYSLEPTHLVTSRLADNTTNIDVRVSIAAYGVPGIQGWVNCPSDGIRSGADPDETCYKQWLKINTSEVSGMDTNQRKSLV